MSEIGAYRVMARRPRGASSVELAVSRLDRFDRAPGARGSAALLEFRERPQEVSAADDAHELPIVDDEDSPISLSREVARKGEHVVVGRYRFHVGRHVIAYVSGGPIGRDRLGEDAHAVVLGDDTDELPFIHYRQL